MFWVSVHHILALIVEIEKSTAISQISSLKSAAATLEETVSHQKSRIETLETSHKDTLILLEKRNADISRNEEVCTQLQAKYVEVRRKISNTENSLQDAQGQVSTLIYKEQSLQQEVEFLRKDNERLVGELNTKAADFSTYRKEKVSSPKYGTDDSLRKFHNCNLNSRKLHPWRMRTPNRTAF